MPSCLDYLRYSAWNNHSPIYIFLFFFLYLILHIIAQCRKEIQPRQIFQSIDRGEKTRQLTLALGQDIRNEKGKRLNTLSAFPNDNLIKRIGNRRLLLAILPQSHGRFFLKKPGPQIIHTWSYLSAQSTHNPSNSFQMPLFCH